MKDSPKIYTEFWPDYELIDAGGNQKLERWGNIITIRPERQAYFQSGMPFTEWNQLAHWKFEEKGPQKGIWKQLKETQRKWSIAYSESTFELELTQFKHLGLFPEQRTNWDFLKSHLDASKKMLNLFAYTGASSMAARSTGAEVLHVDSIKQMLDWANCNQQNSGLDGIKWVLEDALKFAMREKKRGNTYDVIQMDPPAFGHGSKGEKWKLEERLDELLQLGFDLLNRGGWLILNTYSPRVELTKTRYNCRQLFRNEPECSAQLFMKTTSGKDLYFGDLIRIQKK